MHRAASTLTILLLSLAIVFCEARAQNPDDLEIRLSDTLTR